MTINAQGTLNLAGFNETINGLNGAGTVDGGSGTPTFTVGDNNATSNFTGTIKNTAGSLALVKIGTGTLTLGGTNTYSGNTTDQCRASCGRASDLAFSGGTVTLNAPGELYPITTRTFGNALILNGSGASNVLQEERQGHRNVHRADYFGGQSTQGPVGRRLGAQSQWAGHPRWIHADV